MFDYPEEKDDYKYENITLSDNNEWVEILSKYIKNVENIYL